MRRLTAALAIALVGMGLAAGSSPAAARPTAALPPIGHVFVIILENKDYDVTFGADSKAPYLSQTLPSQGQLLTQYHGIGHVSLDNYIAMISGQAPNSVTQSDCQIFQDFLPGVTITDGQAVGQGCVYPTAVPNLPGQLTAAGRTWKGYMEDMGTPCRHPALNGQDSTQQAKVGDQYAGRHNPFIYFHSIIDDDASCKTHVVDYTQLATDLGSVATTANFTFVTPNLCHDGHDTGCVDGQPGGLVSADLLLKQVVPKILDSPAYKQDGALLITFDEAEFSPNDPSQSTACCGEVAGPNSPSPGINGPGGGRVGAVVLSQFTGPGTTNNTPYNHYSLLRTIEDIFGVDHLGFAAAAGLAPMGTDVFGATASSAGQGTSTGRDVAAPAGPSRSRAGGELSATGRSSSGPLTFAAVTTVAALGAFAMRRRLRRV